MKRCWGNGKCMRTVEIEYLCMLKKYFLHFLGVTTSSASIIRCRKPLEQPTTFPWPKEYFCVFTQSISWAKTIQNLTSKPHLWSQVTIVRALEASSSTVLHCTALWIIDFWFISDLVGTYNSYSSHTTHSTNQQINSTIITVNDYHMSERTHVPRSSCSCDKSDGDI